MVGAMLWVVPLQALIFFGSGGSIGSELCRQIARFEPAQLVLFEHNEFALYRMEQEFAGQHPHIALHCVIGDVKNAARVAEALAAHRPGIVFHAAAYKHVPLMEQENAWEAIHNNVFGTRRVAEAAAWGGEIRARLHRQGGHPDERDGGEHAPGRNRLSGTAGRERHPLRHRALRQRAWLYRQRDSEVPRTDRAAATK